MRIVTDAELQGLHRAGTVVAEALAAMRAAVEPGATPAQLDRLCGEVFDRHGARSGPREHYDAPVNAFVSIGSDVVHGLPTERPFEPGDVVKLDVTPVLDGFVADAAITVIVPPADPVAERLVACAEAAFASALAVARAGRPVNVIGRAIERETRKRGFRVIRELSGHGVGRAIHEAPDVLNYHEPRDRYPLREGLVLAIEPMVAAGEPWIDTRADGWTIGTLDDSLTAHYEHTVIIGSGEPAIVTA